jgi:flagellar hook assembly protein FlgD
MLNPAYPNPFNLTTMLPYTLPEEENVTIQLLDLRGRILKVHHQGKQKAGNHLFKLDGKNLSSGSYIAQVEAAGSTLTQKISLIK